MDETKAIRAVWSVVITLALLFAWHCQANAEGIARAPLADVLEYRLTFPSSRDAGNPYQVAHCRRAPAGCRARLEAFVVMFEAQQEVDPWLLAAMAIRESGLSPFAAGAAGERGILQIHPRSRGARKLSFVRDPDFRERCRTKLGACQGPIVAYAAAKLRRALEMCDGDIAGALTAYNTGRCDHPRSRYAGRVLRTRLELLELAENIAAGAVG